MTSHGKEIYKAAFNAAYKKYGEKRAHMIANAAVTKAHARKKHESWWNGGEKEWLTDFDYNSLLSRLRDETEAFGRSNEDASDWKRAAAHTLVGAGVGAALGYIDNPEKTKKKRRKHILKTALAGGISGGLEGSLHDVINKHYDEGKLSNFQSIVEKKLTNKIQENIDMEAAVTDDGYLITADSPRLLWNWWGRADDDDLDHANVVQLHNVPEDLASRLTVHGTSSQHFSDGYEAWEAVRKYAKESA